MRNKNRAQTAKPHTRKKPHTQAHIAATERPRGEHIKMNKKLADDDGFWLLFQKHTCINLPIPTDEVSERLSADLLLQTVVNNKFYRSFGAATRILLLLQYIIYWFTLSSLFSRGPLVRVSSLVRSAPAADDLLLLRSPCPFYDCSSFSAVRRYLHIVNKENRRRLLICGYILPIAVSDVHRPRRVHAIPIANTESLNDFCWFCLLPNMEIIFLVIWYDIMFMYYTKYILNTCRVWACVWVSV